MGMAFNLEVDTEGKEVAGDLSISSMRVLLKGSFQIPFLNLEVNFYLNLIFSAKVYTLVPVEILILLHLKIIINALYTGNHTYDLVIHCCKLQFKLY